VKSPIGFQDIKIVWLSEGSWR